MESFYHFINDISRYNGGEFKGYLQPSRCETYVKEFIYQNLMQKTASKSMQK